MFRWKIFPYLLLTLTVALGTVAGTSHPSLAFDWRDLIRPGIQVIELSRLSDKQEIELGSEINQQIVSQVKLSTNRSINKYVGDIGDRLVPHSTRPNLKFQFQVVEDDAINAFATMGGFVYVNTGLLKAADNEAQVAGVMAHEIGHITGKHAIKQIRQQIIAQGLADAAGVERNQIVQLGVQVGLNLPRSRSHEYNADAQGLDNLVSAGYAPLGMVQFFQKLVSDKGRVPTILSTHPATENRIGNLQNMINKKYPGQEKVGYGLDSAAYRRRIASLR
ncbi:MAG: M48 family metalloprotease [Prochloron sp. SP5CPC1]|nr:M48 family metalloprotease [Candidatus Paraprochloron terpiosi SP5CPC1]